MSLRKAKGGSFEFQAHEAKGLKAIENRKAAAEEIVCVALAMGRATPGPVRLALWEPLMEAVTRYRAADSDIAAAWVALSMPAKENQP